MLLSYPGKIQLLASLLINSQNERNKKVLKKRTHSVLLLSLLATVLTVGVAAAAPAQSSQSSTKWKPVELKLPAGYMPVDFPEKRAGKLLLNPKKPAGMFIFIVYPKEGEGADVLPSLLKATVAEMFFHGSKSPVTWTETNLPSHKGVDNETGTLFSSANEKMEIQLVIYTRTIGATTVLYGYYGMRHKGKQDKDDAPFLDSSGKGVDDFDKFW